ncbi:Hsp20/alpha crystallin family protein, partial [bacterium]|nr:Hsp20/alpha crystallin family protein [bacterium]
MAEKDEKEKEEGKKAGLDFGMGLGGIFGGIGNLIESVSKIAEEGKGIVSKAGEIKGLGDKVKGVYGFTVRTLAGGESKVEPFGNIKKTPKGPVVEKEREPIVDVFDEK